MDNKRVGTLIIIFAVLLGALLFTIIKDLQSQEELLLCNPSADCVTISKKLDLTHFATGIITAILTLGIYLIFFNKSEQTLLKHLQEQKSKQTEEDKISLITKVLDKNEVKVLKAIKEQEGITQYTLRLRTDLSKAKVSQILSSFEKKGIIVREKKGKSMSVHLKEGL